jgi:glycosyltransferase involved in cell wall biosynthesis
MVSVIVPVYNMEAYLPCCLDSLAKQELSLPIEVILVDDGSVDTSPEICAEYCRQHLEAIYLHQENKGLSEARNTGVRVAHGDWVFFLDADDWLSPHALATMLSFAETRSCDMVVGSFFYAHEDHLLYDDRWFESPDPFVLSREEAMKELVLQHYFKNFAWGKLYRTASVKKFPFRPGVYFEDSFWQHLMIDDAQRIGVIPEPLYYYRQRKESISGTFSERNLDLLRGTEERFRFIMDRYPALTKLAAKAFCSLCFQQKELAGGMIPAIDTFWTRIQREYEPIFASALRLNPYYFASRHCPAMTKVLQLGRRGFDHFFAKRPQRIPIASQA